MRIRVDPDKCQGHNRCKAVAPELCVLDRFGNASAVGDGRVPPGFEEKARLAVAYTRHIPVKVIAHMLAVPETDSDQFIKWIHEILELGITDDVVLMQAVREMAGYFAGHIAQRRDNPERRNRPKDDLISQLLEARIDGKLLDDQHLNGMLRLLLIAGIDTTWSGIGAALWHLARTPVDRDRLIAEPALMPMAIEEFLRAFSPVTMAREVMKDTEIGGRPIKAGNMVLLSVPAANRDPAVFP